MHLWFVFASYAIDCWPFKRRELVSGEHLNRLNQELSIFLFSQNKLFHPYFFPSSIFFPPFFSFPFSCQPFCSLVLTNPLSSVALTSKEWGSLILKSRSKKASRHKSVLAVQGRTKNKQKRSNLSKSLLFSERSLGKKTYLWKGALPNWIFFKCSLSWKTVARILMTLIVITQVWDRSWCLWTKKHLKLRYFFLQFLVTLRLFKNMSKNSFAEINLVSLRTSNCQYTLFKFWNPCRKSSKVASSPPPRHRIRLAAVSGQRQQGWVSGLASRLPTTEADTDCTEACRRHTERAAGTSLNLTLQGERRGGVGASEAGGGRGGPAAAGGHMGECSGSAAGLRWNCTASLGLEWLRCPWPPRMGRPPASK